MVSIPLIRPRCQSSTNTHFLDDSDQAQAYNTYNGQEEHDPSAIHELIAGAASYEAAKAYENHVAENGTYTTPSSLDHSVHRVNYRDRPRLILFPIGNRRA